MTLDLDPEESWIRILNTDFQTIFLFIFPIKNVWN